MTKKLLLIKLLIVQFLITIGNNFIGNTALCIKNTALCIKYTVKKITKVYLNLGRSFFFTNVEISFFGIIDFL